MLEGKGRYWKIDGRLYVYIPAVVANDSTCPIAGSKGDVRVRIDGKKLVIEKL